MFMTEAARGCSRGCTYCVMRRSTNGGMRIVPREAIIAGIPEGARKVGLVGAAVTDHPDIAAIVRDVVDGGREVGISLAARRQAHRRAGRAARPRRLPDADRRGRRRERAHAPRDRAFDPGRPPDPLGRSYAAMHRLKTLKVYMMLGVPSETDADVDELVALSKELAAIASAHRLWPRAVRRQAQHPARRHRVRRDRRRRGPTRAPPQGPARGRPRCQGRGPRDLRALGVGRVHDRAGRVECRSRRDGCLSRGRRLRGLQEGVRGARRRAHRPARPRAVGHRS